ncbi:unnamed protein product [Ectocarpus sp. CCAP 1310/34]|nr:unnamed protein product [Ectocarpus sp. CCAP 1310/34]
MASLQIKTGTAASATRPPTEHFQLVTSMTSNSRAVPPSVVQSPPGSFSEAIDRIGLGPFQTRLAIMCGMVGTYVQGPGTAQVHYI